MKCPHCQVKIHSAPREIKISPDSEGFWVIAEQICPSCNRAIIELVQKQRMNMPMGEVYGGKELGRYFVRPKVASRPHPPAAVPHEFSIDYIEASLVLTDSPKASAALSRRCLQVLLRDKAGVKKGDLANEIQQILDEAKLPSHLLEAIDAVRNIGNFAAHPMKSQTTGSVVDVEPGEAEWNLDVLDGLFDFYFIQPELAKKRLDALNAKLADVKKPPVK